MEKCEFYLVLLKVLFLAAFPGSYLFVFAKNIRSRTREFRQLGMTLNPAGIELNAREAEQSDEDHDQL